MAPADIICISITMRKYQRHAGQRIGAELADEIGFDQPDGGLRQHHQHVGRGEPESVAAIGPSISARVRGS